MDGLAVGEAVEEEEEGVERHGAAVERDELWGIVIDDDGSAMKMQIRELQLRLDSKRRTRLQGDHSAW